MLTIPLFLVASALAGPLNESLVPPDQAWVIHLDIDAANNSKLGRHIIDNHEKFNLGGLDGLEPFGVKPFRDFHSVTIFAPRGNTKVGVVTIQSNATIDALVNHLKTEPNAKTMTVDGLEVLSWDDKGTRKYAHVRPGDAPDQRIVSICDDWAVLTSSIKAAKEAKPAQGSPSPRPGSIFFFRTTDLAALTAANGDANAKSIFSGSTQATLDTGEADSKVYTHASIQCDQPQTAADLKEVLAGVLAFARLAPRGNPDAAPLADATKQAKVVAEGKTLTLDAAWDPAQASTVLETLAAMHGNNTPKEDEAGKKDKGE